MVNWLNTRLRRAATVALTLLAAVDELHALLEEFPRDVKNLLHLVGHCDSWRGRYEGVRKVQWCGRSWR